MHGNMMNEVDQKFKGQEMILLPADGKKQLLKESSENIIIQTVDDTRIPTKNSRKVKFTEGLKTCSSSVALQSKKEMKKRGKTFFGTTTTTCRTSHQKLSTSFTKKKKLDHKSQSKLS